MNAGAGRARRPEVLCPAGSADALKAAVVNGADAVYFGGRRFSARGNAENFDDDGIKNAVAFCHERGVKVYITLNTLIFETEMQNALSFASVCCRAGVDALILQDLGIAALLRKAAPGMKLHASTQMSIHNEEGIEQAAALGFSRVVLARELSRDEMARMVAKAKSLGVETEVFVHGALCFSLSGQCLLSSALGERSANRGLCAQPCRLSFSAPGGTGHDLSLKDLCLLEHIGELAEVGVDSLKIEGRMKKPAYVAASAAVYSRAAKGLPVPRELLERLRSVFSRSGFTDGYFTSRAGRDMFGVRRPEDTDDGEEPETAAGPGPIAADFTFEAFPGRPMRLAAEDGDGNRAEAFGPVPQMAKKTATDERFIRNQLAKTGGTPFNARRAEISVAPGLFCALGSLNAMRREVLETLREKRRGQPVSFDVSVLDKTVLDALQFQFRKKFSTKNEKTVENQPRPRLVAEAFGQLEPVLRGNKLPRGSEVFLPLAELLQNIGSVKAFSEKGVRFGVRLPAAVFGFVPPVYSDSLRELRSLGISDALCPNLGWLPALKKLGFEVHGDFGLNIANPFSLMELLRMGAKTAVLSTELTAGQAKAASAPAKEAAGIVVYGNLPVTLSRLCPLRNGRGCGNCRHRIADRRGNAFPVFCRENKSYVRMFNPMPLWLLDKPSELRKTGVGFAEFLFLEESPSQVAEILHAYAAGLPGPGPFTRGHFIHAVR